MFLSHNHHESVGPDLFRYNRGSWKGVVAVIAVIGRRVNLYKTRSSKRKVTKGCGGCLQATKAVMFTVTGQSDKALMLTDSF